MGTFFFQLYKFPQIGLRLCDGPVGEYHVVIDVIEPTRLRVTVARDGQRRTYTYQPIAPVDGTDGTLNIAGSVSEVDSLPQICMSGTFLTESDETAHIAVKHRIRRIPFLLNNRIDFSGELTGLQRFFLETVSDLISKMSAHSEYQTIKAFSLVRLLLTDGAGLVNAVNKDVRAPVKFPVKRLQDFEEIAGEPVQFDSSSLYPAWEDEPYASLSLSKFLGLKILSDRGQDITVAKMIETFANSMGGVHYNDFEKDAERAIVRSAYDQFRSVDGNVISYHATSICHCLLDAIVPLCQRMAAQSFGERGEQA